MVRAPETPQPEESDAGIIVKQRTCLERVVAKVLVAAVPVALIFLFSASSSAFPPAHQKKTADPSSGFDGPMHVDASRAMQYVREIVAMGRRAPGSPGQKRQQAYLRAKLKDDHLEEDVFTASTPAGKFEFRNLIAKFPGTTGQIVVIASHYDTLYSLKNFVGANDGGSSTGLLLEIANQLRGKKRTGPAIWLVWFDGEEAFQKWTDTDSVYGSRHLAAKWQEDGTAKKIKAFILADMIGDSDLNIDRDANSAPWLSALVFEAATNLGRQSYFYQRSEPMQDDHTPFAAIGVPVVDLIDFNYGYNNVFWHTPQDTVDKLSAHSLQIVGDVILETVRLLKSRP